MTILLTTPVPIPNITRWTASDIRFDDNNFVVTLCVEFRSPPATNQLLSRANILINNGGNSTKISRATPIVGGNSADIFSYGNVTLPTGYNDAVTVWRNGANATARTNALEAYLLSSGVMDSSFAGA